MGPKSVIFWPNLTPNNWRTRFSQICGFQRGVHRHFVLSFSVKKVGVNDLDFRQNSKKIIFYHIFEIYWMIQIFSTKSGSVSFFLLLSFNFMPIFGKILWPVFEKNSERMDERTNDSKSIGPTSEIGGSKKCHFGLFDQLWPQISQGTRFFPDMRFSGVFTDTLYYNCLVKESWDQWLRISEKSKNLIFYHVFEFLNDPDFFWKIRLHHFLSFIVL